MLRRLLRHSCTILSDLSLLLCVAAAVLCVRSYSVGDRFSWTGRSGRAMILSEPGRFWLSLSLGSGDDWPEETHGFSHRRHYPTRTGDDLRFFRHHFGEPESSWESSRGGGTFGYWHWRYSGSRSWGSYRFLAVPLWFLCLVLLAPPAVWLGAGYRRRHIARRRRGRGHCAHCGYDLRGNVSGVCPECAAPAPSSVGW
jgi:hypothetical protein